MHNRHIYIRHIWFYSFYVRDYRFLPTDELERCRAMTDVRCAMTLDRTGVLLTVRVAVDLPVRGRISSRFNHVRQFIKIVRRHAYADRDVWTRRGDRERKHRRVLYTTSPTGESATWFRSPSGFPRRVRRAREGWYAAVWRGPLRRHRRPISTVLVPLRPFQALHHLLVVHHVVRILLWHSSEYLWK